MKKKCFENGYGKREWKMDMEKENGK